MNTANLKKAILALALVLVVGACATGCMRSNVGRNDAAAPSPSPDYMPQGTAMNGNAANNNAVQNQMNPFDWGANAARIEAQISKISEISEARVVVAGNTALVGVKFNPAYQGEMTERIREMIAAEIMKADPEITTVAVTAEEGDVQNVYDISSRVSAGTEMDTLKEDINEIVRNATTLR